MPRDRTATEQRAGDRAAFERKVADVGADGGAAAGRRRRAARDRHVLLREDARSVAERRRAARLHRRAGSRPRTGPSRSIRITSRRSSTRTSCCGRKATHGDRIRRSQAALMRDADTLAESRARVGAGCTARRADSRGHPRQHRRARRRPRRRLPLAVPRSRSSGSTRTPTVTAAADAPVKTKDVRPIYAPMVIASGVQR